MIKKFLLKLLTDDAMREAKETQKAEDETFYLEAQRKLRKRYQAAFDKNASDYAKKVKKKIIEVREKDQEEIKNLKAEIKRLKEENDRYLSAVAMVAPYGHKLQIHHTRMVEEAKADAMAENRRYARLSQQGDALEADISTLTVLMPKIKDLLRIDEEKMEAMK